MTADKILEAKKSGANADTRQKDGGQATALEREIDVMVYHLYKLTYDEAKVVDQDLSEEEFEKYS